MRRLPQPDDDAIDVFLDCISNIRDKDFRNRLQSCQNKIDKATKIFHSKAKINKVHTIKCHSNISGIVTNTEMSKVYKNKMVAKSSPGRKYYDKFISVPKHGICPLCGQRIVSTLDHYLPKNKYPSLAVSPLNLIPACKDCNTIKGEKVFSNSYNELIHPYYDNIENEKWLHANIIEEKDIVIKFYVVKPNEWDDILFQRVKNHFNLLQLNKLYSSHAAEELSTLHYILVRLYKKTGSDGVKEQLKEYIECHEHIQLNSWKTAMYTALYECEWFWKEWIKDISQSSLHND